MKKNFFWLLVTMLALCSGTVFMSCSDKENTDSDSPQIPEKPTMPKITEDFEDFATWNRRTWEQVLCLPVKNSNNNKPFI